MEILKFIKECIGFLSILIVAYDKLKKRKKQRKKRKLTKT